METNVLQTLTNKYPKLFNPFWSIPGGLMIDTAFLKALMSPEDCALLDKYLNTSCKGLGWSDEDWELLLPKKVLDHFKNAPIGDNSWIDLFLYNDVDGKPSRSASKTGNFDDMLFGNNFFNPHSQGMA